MSSNGSPQAVYDFPRHDYRGSRFAYRWNRTLVFVAFLILNNLAWTYLYTRGEADSISRFLPKTHEVVISPARSSPDHKMPSPPVHHAVAPRSEAIPIVMVMLGSDSATEGAMTIKSALMYSSRPLVFHIICSNDAIPVIQHKLRIFSRPSYPLDVTFYPVAEEAIKARAGRARIGTKRAHWGALAKVFIHELLPAVDRAIFVDTDMLFVIDPVLLWNTFSILKPDQIIAFPTLGPKSDASRICTCVMLLNLNAMRNTKRPFMSSTLVPGWSENALSSKAFKLTLAGDGMIPDGDRSNLVKFDPLDPLYGDQGLYHVIWTHFPELFAHLSLRWDVTHCRQGYGLKLGQHHDSGGEEVSATEQVKEQHWMEEAPEKFEQLLPGILHFNCQNKPIVWDFEENYQENTWAAMITTITRYKWIWLNRGDGSATIKTRIEKNVRFEDERVADDERSSRMALEEGIDIGDRRKRLD